MTPFYYNILRLFRGLFAFVSLGFLQSADKLVGTRCVFTPTLDSRESLFDLLHGFTAHYRRNPLKISVTSAVELNILENSSVKLHIYLP